MPNSSLTPFDWFKFADNAYSDPSTTIPTGWEPVSNIPAELLKGSNGYQASVFINPSTGEIVIAHRGSDETKDWIKANSALISDKLTKKLNVQFQNAQKLTEYIMGQYPNANIRHTGHSLGGWLAQMVGLANAHQAVSIDSPGVLNQIKLMNKILAKNGFAGACNDPKVFITAFQSRTNLVNTNPFGQQIVEPIPLFNETILQKIATFTSLKKIYDSFDFHSREFIKNAYDTNTGLLKYENSFKKLLQQLLLSIAVAVVKTRNQQTAKTEQQLKPYSDKTSNAINQLESVVSTYKPRTN